VLNRLSGPTVVAGHSYEGQIMTALGTDAPNVVALVCIAAFGLDESESIGGLLAQGPPTPALAHLHIDVLGFAWLPEDDFVNHFAADVDPAKAKVMRAPSHCSPTKGSSTFLAAAERPSDGRAQQPSNLQPLDEEQMPAMCGLPVAVNPGNSTVLLGIRCRSRSARSVARRWLGHVLSGGGCFACPRGIGRVLSRT
jgi:pimeloyl-ACP methyl ester carboxylesterase